MKTLDKQFANVKNAKQVAVLRKIARLESQLGNARNARRLAMERENALAGELIVALARLDTFS